MNINIHIVTGPAFGAKTRSEPTTVKLLAVPAKGDILFFRGVKHSVDAVEWTAAEALDDAGVTLLLTPRP